MKNTGKIKNFIFEISEIFAVAIVIILIITSFFIRVINVSGTSMETTLYEGDRLILSSFFYEPSRGDIIVSSQPNSKEKLLIKRVIAVSGDTIDINWINGAVSINGVEITEDYIESPVMNTFGNYKNEFPITVPEGYVFVMGDNRGVSWDSRYKEVGLIRVDYILGKAIFRMNDFSAL